MNKAVLILVSLAAGVAMGTLIPDSRASVEASAGGTHPSAPIQATLQRIRPVAPHIVVCER
jgi:hypothetical protein